MSKEDKIRNLWESKFWDAVGCGMNEEQAAKVAGNVIDNRRKEKTMKYVIEIDCDNDAFEDHPAWEVKRILKVLVEKMHGEYDPPDFLTLYDMNGNAVGTAVYSECSIT